MLRVEHLMIPMHVNYRCLAVESMPAFALHDVVKNSNVDWDLERFGWHLEAHFC